MSASSTSAAPQSSDLFPIFETVLALGHVEDHGMSMKLERRVAIYGPRGVVLESGGDEFSGRLRGMDIADPRLRVSFKLLKCCAYTLPMGFPHPIIAAHKRGERYRLRRRELASHPARCSALVTSLPNLPSYVLET